MERGEVDPLRAAEADVHDVDARVGEPARERLREFLARVADVAPDRDAAGLQVRRVGAPDPVDRLRVQLVRDAPADVIGLEDRVEHVLRLAAQQQALDALAAVRGHEDGVALAALGGGNDGAIRVLRLHDHVVERHACGFGRGLDLADAALRELARAPVELPEQVFFDRVPRVVQMHRARLLGVEPGHPGAHFPGELNARADGLGGNSRAVGRNQDVLEHGCGA